MSSELVLDRCELPEEVRNDMAIFIEMMGVTDQDIKNLKIHGVKATDIQQLLIDAYL